VSVPADAAAGAERVLAELVGLERELVEAAYVRRADALERVTDAVRRLGEIGAPQGILERAAEELGTSSDFDRVMLGEVRASELHVRAVWSEKDPEAAAAALDQLRRASVPLEYPSVEDEVARRQRTEIVRARVPRSRAARRLAEVLDWDGYVVTALVVQGQTVGLLHADATASGRVPDVLDAEVAFRYAEGLAGVFERAVLREMLQLHHHELRSGVEWMSARLTQLAAPGAEVSSAGNLGESAATDALTARELDVLRLLARGQTNLEIAHQLVVREGTIKYHVKNILRKMGATSRADAVSRYARSAP
jgi:LuxR family transcriptional regulator, regulator of acetate metabolism